MNSMDRMEGRIFFANFNTNCIQTKQFYIKNTHFLKLRVDPIADKSDLVISIQTYNYMQTQQHHVYYSPAKVESGLYGQDRSHLVI